MIQIASKIKRFGIESFNPFIANPLTNRLLLQQELGDVLTIIFLLEEAGVLTKRECENHIPEKLKRLEAVGSIPPRPAKKALLGFCDRMTPEQSAAWVEMCDDVTNDRRRSNIADEIREEARNVTDVQTSIYSRKYLLRQAAELFAMIERMPDED